MKTFSFERRGGENRNDRAHHLSSPSLLPFLPLSLRSPSRTDSLLASKSTSKPLTPEDVVSDDIILETNPLFRTVLVANDDWSSIQNVVCDFESKQVDDILGGESLKDMPAIGYAVSRIRLQWVLGEGGERRRLLMSFVLGRVLARHLSSRDPPRSRTRVQQCQERRRSDHLGCLDGFGEQVRLLLSSSPRVSSLTLSSSYHRANEPITEAQLLSKFVRDQDLKDSNKNTWSYLQRNKWHAWLSTTDMRAKGCALMKSLMVEPDE